jgi:hypothetical protein
VAVDVEHEGKERFSFVMLWRPVSMFVASRAVVFLAFVTAAAAHPGLSFHRATSRWDSAYYLHIASVGYPTRLEPKGHSIFAFFPGFPAITFVVRHFPGLDSYRAGMIVVFVAGLAAACLLWLMTRDIYDIDAADRTTALFVFAPGTFVFSMIYAEAVFLCFAIAACWALVRRRWVVAGILGALTAATRPNGLAIVVAAAWAAYLAIRRRKELRSLVAPVLAFAGFAGVLAYMGVRAHQAGVWFAAERRWGEETTLGTGRWYELHHLAASDLKPDWNHIASLTGLMLFVVLMVFLVRARPPSELIAFAAAIGFFAFTSRTLGFRPRFVLSAFPLFMGLGVTLRRSVPFAVVLAVSASLLVVLTVITATTFFLTP